jgi:DinB superfamily
MDKAAVVEEMERARADFHRLLDSATSADLRAPSNGTRWTNEQLLYHMLFGYLVVRTVLILVRILARAPDGVSRVFAGMLNSATRPFHTVNYIGSLVGARILGHAGMERLLDRVVRRLQTRLQRDSDAELRRGMHFPVGWDPYFTDYMTIGDVYHYATQHYDHHRRQLTLPDRDRPPNGPTELR